MDNVAQKSRTELKPEKQVEKLIIDRSVPGRKSYSLPKWNGEQISLETCIPCEHLRAKKAALPEVAELEIVRHFTRLSQKNFSVDTHFYPLGSCTMKYNPKFNEEISGLSGFSHVHPLQPQSTVQGTLRILYHLEQLLNTICGMDAFTLQPAAGAHGELVGMMIIKSYHEKNGGNGRTQVIVPDSSHGTNPSSAHLAGYEVVSIPSNDKGMVDLDQLKAALSDKTAAFMLTNPNTLGVFDTNILAIAKMVHQAGALLYYDGANLNPLLGISRPGDMGFDVVHVNVHKTFSTPHGGGGPGAGPVGVKKRLIPYLPIPRVVQQGGTYSLEEDNPDSIGRVLAFYANVGILIRSYAYIIINGLEGLTKVGENAILNANYLMARLKKYYSVPHDEAVMHEFVISLKEEADRYGVRAVDVAKWLIDSGIHPPTIYFPLIVAEALMVEPTETEARETLDQFVEEMIRIHDAIRSNADIFHDLPMTTPVSRPDEVLAARKPVLNWHNIHLQD
ncbi:MAG: aminomethyl-transferring glycine dehydrogenase subunit GcvPB [Candidatus Auribacterota bacterium]